MTMVTLMGSEVNAAITHGAATNLSSAKCVRVFNSHTASLLVTRCTAAGVTIGTATIGPKEIIYLYKNSDEKIFAAATTVKLVPVGYLGG